MSPKERRVRLRVGHHHALVKVLDDYQEALQGLYDLTHQAVNARKQTLSADVWDAAVHRIERALTVLVEVAEKSLGARLSADDSPD